MRTSKRFLVQSDKIFLSVSVQILIMLNTNTAENMCLGREGQGQIKLQLSVNVQAGMSGARCLDSLPFITKSTQIAE